MATSKRAIGRWKASVILAVCAAPLIASYLTYYVIKPQARTNYGTLLDPRNYPIPAQLDAIALDGQPTPLRTYQGKWIMLMVHGAACPAACETQLYNMRQLRLTQGRDQDRIERVWLITDRQPVETMLMRKYDGMRLLRVRQDVVQAWLPANTGTAPSDHLYMIDPLGNLMMRFPQNPDPNKIKKDLTRLLKASSIG